MARKGTKPMCGQCGRFHYNFLDCSKVHPEPTIEWQNKDGFHEWGDRVQGAAGGPVQDGGWGCRTILPAEKR